MTEQQIVPISPFVMPSRLPCRKEPDWLAVQSVARRETFDCNTVFYDIFQRGSKVVAVGPALQRPFRTFLKQAQIKLDGMAASFTELSQSQRSSTIAFDAPVKSPKLLEIQHDGLSTALVIGANHKKHFAGMHVMTTLSHNNELEWIRDWARYHVEEQGVEAILFFDNASDRYGPTQIAETLSTVNGLEKFQIISMPFQYGPSGTTRQETSCRFLQFGAFEIARLRFLSEAKGVLNLDVDEMAYSPAGQTVFDQLKHQAEGVLTLPGQWRYPANGAPKHHSSHVMRADPETAEMYPKWCLAPNGPKKGKMWRTHGLKGLPDQTVEGFGFFHCRMISTNWHYDRAGFSELNLVPDPHAQSLLGAL